MPEPEIPRDELQAALRARGELDRELEPHVVDSFLDRVERSIGLGIGATGAANGMGATNGLIVAIVAWVAIALINIANAVHR